LCGEVYCKIHLKDAKEWGRLWNAILESVNNDLNDEIGHHHKHQGLDPLIRSVSRVTAVFAPKFLGLPIVLLPYGL